MNGVAMDESPAGTRSSEVLVIGFGNVMRGDDGVGPAVAEGVERLGLPGVRVEVCHQLTPEWACRVSEAAGVVFVDAGEAILSADGGVRVRELDGSATSMGWSGHRFTPEVLLALVAELGWSRPRAWSVVVPVEAFGWGLGLTPEAKKGVEAAVGAIRGLWEGAVCTRRA